MVWCACCQDPHKRANLSSIVYKLARLAAKESFDDSQPELEPANTFDEYQSGRLTEAWVKLETNMENCDNVEHCRAFKELKIVRQRLRESTHRLTLFERFHTLLTEFYRTVTMSPEQARIMRLSSTRATNSTGLSTETEARWQQQRSDQTSFFVSGLSDTFLLLSDLKSPEERSAFLTNLKIEMKNPVGKYTSNQLEVMKHAYNEIASKLETEDLAELTPEWFIPWYELIIDEWNCLGEGGFGSVSRAKWLDSEVVVKRVILAGSHSESSTCTFDLSQSYSSFWDDPSASQAQVDTAKRAEARAIFRREVDIWFGFSHPHVVRLFGACHIGRPFFVCEYATNGTLVCHLRKHPEQLWSKLHEAALGVQYLHAREIVHGDLKGNNIVNGSDKKAKVTDFGLSSVASSEEQAHLISGAWHWLAPECLLDTNKRPTIAADVYSLGMCVIEALRVVEAAKLSQDSCHCLPWRVADRVVVKYHATHGTLPSRPTICEDGQ